MPLFPGIIPKPGDIYMCDFSGYVVPEIVKLRRVVVVSPSNPGARLALVVPISLSRPIRTSPVQIELPGEAEYRCFAGAPEVWAKADLIAHVRFDRLDRVRIPLLDPAGRPIPRKFEYLSTISLSAEHLDAVRGGVLRGLGLGRLAAHL